MNPSGRKISAGTRVILVLTLLVMIGSAMVFIRLFSVNHTDATRISSSKEETDDHGKSLASSETAEKRKQQYSQYYAQSVEATIPPGGSAGGRFTMTVAGTAAIEGDIRKSCYLSDVKTYDISDIMSLLRSEIQSDINVVFLENLLMEDEKPTDIIAPSLYAEMLKEAGFNMAACGFQGAWTKKTEGITETRRHLSEAGITPIGIYTPDEPKRVQVLNCGGIPTSILQYSGMISQSDRKKMARENQSETVPAAEAGLIAADIAEARDEGADLVIILMNWGSRAKQPDKNMKKLAQDIADSGADLIIGCGSRTPQTAEYLTASHPDGSTEQVLCVWSLGVTITKDRSNAGKMAGYLFHAEFVMDSSRNIRIQDPSFTPVYTWMYTQDKRTYYRCLAANRTIPDGMEIKQQNIMSKSADVTREALKDSPLIER